MPRYVVGPASDIPDGGCVRIVLRGRPVAVFNQGGEYFALLDRCPHEGARLSCGARVGLIRSTRPGRYDYSRAGEMIRCPWHGWEFDLRTGQSYCDPARTRVRNFKVAVADGASLLAGRETDEGGRVAGPYVAETYPVSVEHEYVLVEM